MATSSIAARSSAVPLHRPDVDQRIVLGGSAWRDYCVLRDLLDSPDVRTTYLDRLRARHHEAIT